MPRLLPIQMDAAHADIRGVYGSIEKNLGLIPNVLKTLAHSDSFLEMVATTHVRLLGDCSLSDRVRSLLLLKVAQLDQCAYTKAHFTRMAKQAGWSDDLLALLDNYAGNEQFSAAEREVLQFAEYVCREPGAIPGPFWTQLDNHFTANQLVEMVVLAGFFSMVNRLALVFETSLEPGLS